MKNKVILIIFSILFFLSSTCSIIGFIRYNKNKNRETNNPVTSNITYEYYLEDLRVNKMPTNDKNTTMSDITEENSYIFKRYNCTNNIVGNFDENNWEFTTTGQDGVCKLYFVNAKYEVKLNVVNGIQDDNNKNIITRESDGIFKIIPNEGHKFKEAVCQNNKEATWDENNKTINISAITSDVSCNIIFEKKEFNIIVNVANGIGNTSEKVLYGDSKSIIVEPKTGYSNPKVQCSNNQNAIFSNNSLNFDKITNDTNCKIVFNKIILPIYNVTIENFDNFNNLEDIRISGVSKINKINEGESFILTITKPSDKEVTLNCGDIVPSETIIENGITKFEILNIKNNINCNIEVK